MAEEGGGGNWRELDQTPTWAVASVCGVIILISILLEKGLTHLGQWFNGRHKKALFEALEKVKSELMVLGFISLLLTFGQSYITRICIPDTIGDKMLPCRLKRFEGESIHQRRMLWDLMSDISYKRRILSEDSAHFCPKGKVSLVSTNALHQLHIFIFFLAVFHVTYSAFVMTLGRAKIRRWKEWEDEVSSLGYESSHDASRFRFAEDVTFVRQHTSALNKISISFYAVSFIRQFFRSVRKADYLAMRHGFITAHLAPGSKFNFQKYIKRALEDDFKIVVGISPPFWASAVIFLLFNVNGLHTLFWLSLLPLIIILAVGTKLQAIITKMALELQQRHTVVQGVPLVQISNNHFWFNHPRLVLFLIHFTLFQNAFQITFFFWIWYEFGLKSCFHESLKLVIARVCMGAGVLFLCSYITLPLYALVSQMGSDMKRAIFNEETTTALMKWRQVAKNKQRKGSSQTPVVTPGSSPNASPIHPAMHCANIAAFPEKSRPSLRRAYSDISEVESEMQSPRSTAYLIPCSQRGDLEHGNTTEGNRFTEEQNLDGLEFSFAKLPVQPKKL